MTHPAIKAAIEALEIAQEELHGLNRTFTAREVVGKRLTALRQLQADCIVIERKELEAMKEPESAVRITDYTRGFGDGYNKAIDALLATKAKG